VKSATESPAEVYSRLTRRQKNDMHAIRAAGNEVVAAEAVTSSKVAFWKVKVFDAVEDGVPVRFLAAELSLSVSRIYQIRDEVAAHRT
jgi:hypothetical protein